MPLDPGHLSRLARLARLELSDAELAELEGRMGVILEFIDRLNELKVEGVPPLDHAVDLVNVPREDAPRAGLPSEAALSNAPAVAGPYFAVPRIIDAP